MDRPANLLISNIPANCPEDYVKLWVEAHGYRIFKVRLVRDSVSENSPNFAYVQLMDAAKVDEAARALDERLIWNHALQVKRASSPHVRTEASGWNSPERNPSNAQVA